MLGQERLGEMILAQNVGGEQLLPSWNDQCKSKSDWIVLAKDEVTQQKCNIPIGLSDDS